MLPDGRAARSNTTVGRGAARAFEAPVGVLKAPVRFLKA